MTQSQMLISALPKLAMTKETCKRMMEVLAWSWQVLWDGVVPKKDKAGDPIEKPFTCNYYVWAGKPFFC